ncbi:MAG: Gfo/Idh/MocA family oxidoreductase [Gemmatimonadetes bacterium]|jgi:predicted dehydrogenase|nr:Gfo/Idh/MocA family oxidoreductase [Gemmatimonadota bacterium]MBT5274948.1 Gfo/Idh/MocA family oxidoreductase [Candidatus Woesearchaeota archaeon]MBT6150141.1 Gfo/Idh/MocA family oxidoreductase [Gemmatimonadota bacterium]MBT7860060.1 Gfo/Idh/MocA family oxidoreductase [Gemmatimonadota bacterium]
MVRIGIVGIGFMGVTHFKAIDKVKGAKVTAIATRDAKKLRGDWRQIQGNFGGSGGRQDLSGIAAYDDVEDLLADPNVDLVDICLPTTMHYEWTMKALAAGKHVLVEKPIALDLKESEKMVALARKMRRRLMVAHVLRFFPEFLLVKDLVEGKEYGKVRAAQFKRVIAQPSWWDPKQLRRTGGPAIDLHIHDADFVQYLFGLPRSVSSSGFVGRGGIIEHIETQYEYASGAAITAGGGWLSQQGCPFEHGYDVFFEDATLKFNSSWGQPPVLLTKDGKKRSPRLSKVDAFVGELQEAVNAVKSGKDSKILSARSATDSLRMCLKEIESVTRARRVKV